MNGFLIAANVLTLLAFFLHTFQGDIEIRMIQPKSDSTSVKQQEIWTMARCGWHWLSVDLLLASIGLGLINFSQFFESPITLLHILFVYFTVYAIVWAFTIFISKPFPKNYLKLGQWILLFVIAGLIFLGIPQ